MELGIDWDLFLEISSQHRKGQILEETRSGQSLSGFSYIGSCLLFASQNSTTQEKQTRAGGLGSRPAGAISALMAGLVAGRPQTDAGCVCVFQC